MEERLRLKLVIEHMYGTFIRITVPDIKPPMGTFPYV